MSYPIKYLSLQKAELEYEVILRGGSTGSVQDLRSQIVKLAIPPEDILESHLEPAVDLDAVKDSLTKSQTMLASLKSKFDKTLFLRTENLLHHIYHRLRRISNVSATLVDQHKNYCTTFNNQYKEITTLRPASTSNANAVSVLEPEATAVLHCDRNLTSDLAKLKYSGKACVFSFIQRVEEFVEVRNISKDRVLKFAYEIFTDDALHWFRCNKESFQSWDDVVVLLKKDFSPKNYDYRLTNEIKYRTQGEQENISIYLSIMHGMFSRLVKPLSEEEKLEIILHNIRPCYASTLAASPEIKDLKTLKTLCTNYEDIQSRLSLFHEPPRVTSETLAPEFAYTKYHKNNIYYTNKNYQNTNSNEKQKNYYNQNKYPNYSSSFNYNKSKTTEEKPTTTNAVQATANSTKNVNTASNSRKYCPRCRTDTHSLKECKQPHFPICFKCGNKGVRYPDCKSCNPKDAKKLNSVDCSVHNLSKKSSGNFSDSEWKSWLNFISKFFTCYSVTAIHDSDNIHNRPSIAAPLNKLTSQAKNSPPFNWSTDAEVAFRTLKEALVSSPILSCPDYTQPFQVHTDASDYGVGAVLTQVIDNQEKVIAYMNISPNQFGFTASKSTTDAIQAVRILMEKHRINKKDLHLVFIDLEKAFDRVPRKLVWQALRAQKVPEYFIYLIQDMYNDVSTRVKTLAGLSNAFEVKVGVHQGSVLSPFLFNLVMDYLTNHIPAPLPWTMLYADDIVLAANTAQHLQVLLNTWTHSLEIHRLRVSRSKTEYLKCPFSGSTSPETICIGSAPIPTVNKFKYLGSMLTADANIDVTHRINLAWQKWRTLTGVLCDPRMPIKTKGKVYKTAVRPVLLYGSECWTVKKTHEQKAHVNEMKMLRWAGGVTRMDRVRNEHIRGSFKVAPITDKMTESRVALDGMAM
ncbi:uncharacterized protein LOC134798981 [Cydia splendana]|uniref:uncharacterized protein LOC134798981 n=1 Tax=Cydia splendana TaxID=1100963 RepID=UPI00300DAEFE